MILHYFILYFKFMNSNCTYFKFRKEGAHASNDSEDATDENSEKDKMQKIDPG